MAANIDTMIYVGATPWHGLGKDLTLTPPENAYEIAASASLLWNVKYERMYSENHNQIPNYNVLYRDDNNEILGVVNRSNLNIVQNVDTFNAVDKMIGDTLAVETAASLGKGETVFGCFKIQENYKLLDDDVEHYFVIVNDHLRPDGKVTVLNTPVRVVCQNTLTEAIGNNYAKMRIPVTAEASINATIAGNLLTSIDNSLKILETKAESMFMKKIDSSYVDKLLDVMFPYQIVDGQPIMSRANESTSIAREVFLKNCMGADNLGNYRGTQWQVFNALTDYTQHYHRSVEKAYDINHRMSLLPGVKQTTETSKVVKFLKIADQLAA